MKGQLLPILAAVCCQGVFASETIVSTDAYVWRGDSIIQGEFVAFAPNSEEIISTYSAQPGYFMPVGKHWTPKNDISSYPRLSTPNTLHEAIYNMALDEMVNAVEPDTTLRTGKEWAGVWTRDVSYSIILSMAYMQPEASRISLMKKVTPDGRIIQDTGSGGAWPVSSDREIWTVAAYEVYKVTGDRKWIEFVYPVAKRSLEDDFETIYDPQTGLVMGETSFIDWREQSHPKWMQTADIYRSETLSTSVVHARALQVMAEMAEDLGKKSEAAEWRRRADELVAAINRELWLEDKGYYGMYLYGRDNLVMNPRAEGLGESLAILWGVADEDRAHKIASSMPVTPFGVPVFYPQIADMPSYHNNALWPWVAAYWTIANAKTGNEEGVMEGFGSIFRPAALFTTNKENLRLDNGDIATELNSSNMLWCLAGNIAITHKVLFGLEFGRKALEIHPFVPKALAGERSLTGFRYRNATVNLTVIGYGDRIAEVTVNGKKAAKAEVPANAKGEWNIVIRMADNDIEPAAVNRVANASAPLTPIARIEGDFLRWNPIEYIGGYVVYKDGKPVARTRTTDYQLTEPGEYAVAGVAGNGTEGFISEPCRYMESIFVEFPGESTAMSSAEISYRPRNGVAGYRGNGFVETDHNLLPEAIEFDAPKDGEYFITLRYANGNGPVNTENKCAIRTLTVDGAKAGVVVMPHRGVANWDDWGETNSVRVNLTKGRHTVGIEFRPENENMNSKTNHAIIDGILIRHK